MAESTSGEPKAKYRRIYEHLHAQIVGGEYPVGHRLPTEAELGEQHGASRLTVARSLRDLEQEGYVVRRRGVGSFVGEWRKTANPLLGLLVPRPGRGVFGPICDEIVRRAEARGHGVLLAGSMGLDPDVLQPSVEEFCEQVVARKVAGVFFAPMEVPAERMSLNSQAAEQLAGAGIPLVLLDRDIYDYPRRSRFDLVSVDNRSGARVLTEHLLSMTRDRIDFVAPRYAVSTITARIAGYQDALRAQGIVPDPEWVHRWDLQDRHFVRNLMASSPPSAFLCVNDRLADSLMHNLAVLGFRVPDDVRIVGFDDVDSMSSLPVALTTMRQPVRHLGMTAAQMMFDRMAEPSLPARETLLACELIVRESCGGAVRTDAVAAAV